MKIGFVGPINSALLAQEQDFSVDFLPTSTALVRTNLSEANLFIHPSYKESFGMVLIEAMVKGIRAIGVATSGAVPWVLNKGRAGALVDVPDEKARAKKIFYLLTEETAWKRFSEVGYAYASEHFRISSVADQYLKCYRQLLVSEAQPVQSGQVAVGLER